MKDRDEELYRQIGERIRQIREKKGESQTTLANALGCKQTIISKIENGEISLSTCRLIEIAKHFDISCDSLCTGNDLNDVLNVLSKYIQLKYDSCPYDDKKQEYLILQINTDLLCYLFQLALSEHLDILPDIARVAWQKAAKQNFHNALKDNTISFIPFPADQIVKDNSPNLWKQPELLEISIDNITNLFS